MSNIHHNMAPALDYSLEAKKLWEKLGINPEDINKDKRGFNPLDIIFKSREGGCVYVGGERAARDLELLSEKNIRAVVNCTDDLRNYHEGRLSYYNFNVAWWRKYVGDSEDGLAKFLSPCVSFIEAELAAGHSVLVHCLAGAHRAGTTGIICLMHFAGLESHKAILTAKALRSIIQPIGDFQQLLKMCDNLKRKSDGKFILCPSNS